ncbi:TetR family transcriptional regulator [Weissella confusa]|uniref:TetR family transcriptional regulator n=1 Tax=Weissella confusa TaxID=1583 RepID=A0A923SMU8_WEICO|nr:TetR family transcriptional regulator [Weissella confusa]
MRQFNLDILENRRLADAAMFQQINWSLELLSAHKVVEPAKLDINLIDAWGGFTVEQGYAKTSFSAVAQRAGLQRSIVQYYFSKKEDFATIVNAQVSETIMAAVDELYPDVDKLSRYYLAYA